MYRFVKSSIIRRRFSIAARRINPAVANLPASGIREILTKGTEMDMKNPEKPVIHLEVGQPNFATPRHIIDATIKSLEEGRTTYTPNNGILTLREAIAQKYSEDGCPTQQQQIVVKVGSSLSLYSLLLTILQPGDHCLLPLPGFPNYQGALSLMSCVSVPYLCPPELGYLPSLETIEQQCTPQTKCIVVCNPGNPTGATYTKELLQSVIRWAHSRDIFVISDEIYAEVTFDEKHSSSALLEDIDGINADMIAIVSGVPKAYAMSGYRIGWSRSAIPIAEQLTKMQEPIVSCSNSFAQDAATIALTAPQECVHEMTAQYRRRRDVALTILAERGRPSAYRPGGAFYLPVNISSSGMPSREFALKLLSEKRCAVAPGIAFSTMDPYKGDGSDIVSDQQRKEYVSLLDSFCRISLANSEENLATGLHLICDLLDEMDRTARD